MTLLRIFTDKKTLKLQRFKTHVFCFSILNTSYCTKRHVKRSIILLTKSKTNICGRTKKTPIILLTKIQTNIYRSNIEGDLEWASSRSLKENNKNTLYGLLVLLSSSLSSFPLFSFFFFRRKKR